MSLPPRPALLALALAGCASHVPELYQAERDAVLAPLPAPPADWPAEVAVRVSSRAVGGIARAAVEAGLEQLDERIAVDAPLGVTAWIRPTVAVDALEVRPTGACDGCLRFDADLAGKVKWAVGGLDGRLPFTARLAGTVRFEVEEKGDRYRVRGRLVDVGKARVSAGAVRELDVAGLLGDHIDEALARVKPFTLAAFGSEGLPVRALRLDSTNRALVVEALTAARGAVPVAAPHAAPGTDWDLRVADDTVLALARRLAFQAGTITDYTIALDPRSLAVREHGFDLGLRLWRLAGRGWWRDYLVHGEVTVGRRQVRFRSTGAEEGDKSPGAGLADPLALLAEGRILEAVADGIREAVPASKGAVIGSRQLRARIADVRGLDGVVTVTGSFTLGGADLLEGAKKGAGRR